MKELEIGLEDLFVGRVLKRDDPDHAIIEVGKGQGTTFNIEDGDQFLTVLFVRSNGAGGYEKWDPFADD